MSPGIRALIIIGVVVVVMVAVAGITAIFRDKDSGTSVETSPVGSCITVSGSIAKIETKAIDCSDTVKVSYIVGAKLDSNDACKTAGYAYSVYEYGSGASDKVLCLVPNLQLGECYEESTISSSFDLKTVACTESSGIMTIAYKVTERVDSKTVPNCTDTVKQKVLAFDIAKDGREIGFCAEILGDYSWQ